MGVLDGWKNGGWKRGWRLGLLATLAVLVLLYGVWCVIVVPSNGTKVQVFIEAGTNPDGSMYYQCDVGRSTSGACDASGTDGNPSQARITVHKRDRVTITVHSLDGGGRAHDFRLLGLAYFLPPAGIEMELHKETQSKSFTAWKTGEYDIICELPGHRDRGMRATIVVT